MLDVGAATNAIILCPGFGTLTHPARPGNLPITFAKIKPVDIDTTVFAGLSPISALHMATRS